MREIQRSTAGSLGLRGVQRLCFFVSLLQATESIAAGTAGRSECWGRASKRWAPWQGSSVSTVSPEQSDNRKWAL